MWLENSQSDLQRFIRDFSVSGWRSTLPAELFPLKYDIEAPGVFAASFSVSGPMHSCDVSGIFCFDATEAPNHSLAT